MWHIVALVLPGLSVAVAMAFLYLKERQRALDAHTMITKLQVELAATNAKLATTEQHVKEQRERIVFLEDRIEFLLGELQRRPLNGSDGNDTTLPKRMVLVAVGPDRDLRADLTAFRSVKERTGMGFMRIMPVTTERFQRATERARRMRDPIRYVHLSVHSGPDGVQFSDRTVDAEWLSRHLKGVKVLVIDGCESTDVADRLGIVPFVISLREKISHDMAVQLAEDAGMTLVGFVRGDRMNVYCGQWRLA